MKKRQQIIRWFNRYLGIDLRALAVMRIGFGVLLLVDLFNRARSFTAHYTNAGVLPHNILLNSDLWNPWFISVHTLFENPLVEVGLFGVAAIFALMLIVGYRTRLATVASWALLVSLHNANPLVLQAGDVAFRLGLFWGIFLPWGARYSFDYVRLGERFSRRARAASIATAAILIQTALIYFVTSHLKVDTAWTGPGATAVLEALHVDHFATRLGVWARGTIPVAVWGVVTLGVYWLQRSAPYALLSPIATRWFRGVWVFLLIGMHTSFMFFMRLGLFPFIDIVLLLAFVPTQTWDWLAHFFGRKKLLQGGVLWYDGECSFCHRSVKLIASLLRINEQSIKPAQNTERTHELMHVHNSWIYIENGAVYDRYGVWPKLVAASPLWSWTLFLWRLPIVRVVGEKIYWLVATNRTTATQLPTATNNMFVQGLALLFLIFVIVWNVNSIPSLQQLHTQPQPWMRSVVYITRLDQYWNMFSPRPLQDDGWFVIEAERANGTTFDIFQHNEPISFNKPQLVSSLYPTQRWRKYMMNLRLQTNKMYRKPYAEYLCRDWYRRTGETLERIRMIYVEEPTAIGQPVETHTIQLGTWTCDL